MSSAAWESLHKATLELAKSSTLKQRLTDAFSCYLKDMPATDMPAELRADFEALCQRMTQIRPMRGETAIAATVRKMSIDEADSCAMKIVALLDALHIVEVAQAPAATDRSAESRTNGQGNSQSHVASRHALDAAARIPTLISINRA